MDAGTRREERRIGIGRVLWIGAAAGRSLRRFAARIVDEFLRLSELRDGARESVEGRFSVREHRYRSTRRCSGSPGTRFHPARLLSLSRRASGAPWDPPTDDPSAGGFDARSASKEPRDARIGSPRTARATRTLPIRLRRRARVLASSDASRSVPAPTRVQMHPVSPRGFSDRDRGCV